MKIVCNDNGIEFSYLKNYFANNGIIFQTLCVGTPHQIHESNGNTNTFCMLLVLYVCKEGCNISFE